MMPAPAQPRSFAKMSKASVLFLSHDTRGLGSFRRQCKIATALHELSPATELLLATSCDLTPPPFIRVLPLPQYGEDQARGTLLLRYVQQHTPRAILVDKHPFGVRMDFKAALKWANSAEIPCFYGLRDILDHPERVKAEWLDVLPAIERYFCRVLVYGERELFDVGQYGLASPKVVYCGFVSGYDGGRPGAEGVLCTVGAGDSNLANHVLRVFSEAQFKERKTLVTGPQNTMPLRGDGPHHALRYCPDMSVLWSTHRAVICLGGYNTLIEAIAFGLHIVCVPRIEPRLEQLVRANLFASRGWLHCIHPEELSVATLEAKVSLPLRPRGRPALAGAETAARTILHEAGLHSEMVS